MRAKQSRRTWRKTAGSLFAVSETIAKVMEITLRRGASKNIIQNKAVLEK
jgi:hypothetical protein